MLQDKGFRAIFFLDPGGNMKERMCFFAGIFNFCAIKPGEEPSGAGGELIEGGNE